MSMSHTDAVIWLNENDLCTIEELVESSGLTANELHELIECGAITPANADAKSYVFEISYIVVARKARRLRDDFELDMQGLALALRLLQRIHGLELELLNYREL